MPKSRPPYPPEFRQRIIELVRKGRTPESLAEQFEPSAQTIRNWLAQADRDTGQRPDGLTTDEREELRRLRRENKTLREEREILKKAAAWFAKETGSISLPAAFIVLIHAPLVALVAHPSRTTAGSRRALTQPGWGC
jgi:transposase